jgi:hypothetical protein
MKRRFWGTLLTCLVGMPVEAGVIWLGNDTAGDVFQTDTAGNVLQQIVNVGVTGVAFDGSSLYFVDRQGNYSVRTPDGSTVVDSFFVASGGTGEDLAWDPVRSRLWRVVHNNTLQEIDPVAASAVNFSLPTSHAQFSTLGALGIAYDSVRDLLYVSYCDAGCATLSKGLVQVVDPNTGTVMGDLFLTSGFATGGLGYDPATDTLWVGDAGTVRNMSLSGSVLSSFGRPSPGGFVDGLEFIPIPEPGSAVLLVAALAGLLRRRHKSG